jgi:ABC-type antimicrobial peptide transport system permease subunit
MEEVVADSLWELNLYRWSIGLFALLALLLAAIGLFGVISYNVSSRMREFAVRLVLGSNPADLARLVLGRAIRLAATGLVLGAVCALATLPLLRKLPAAIDPDAATFAIIAGLLLAVAVVSCLVPAIRVRALNPASALRRDQ